MSRHSNWKKKQQEGASADDTSNTGGAAGKAKTKPETVLLGAILVVLLINTYLLVSKMPDGPQRPVVTNNTPQPAATNAGTDAFTPSANPATIQPQNTPPATPPPTADQTTIAIPNADFDAGEIAVGQAVQHTFDLNNTGSNPLVFGSITVDPPLTITSQPTGPIQPGGTAKIGVEYKPTAPSDQQVMQVHVNGNFPTDNGHTHLRVVGSAK